MLRGLLQALVVLDYKLTIDRRTPDVKLGRGGRQCLVLRGTRVPPSCKWGGTEIGPLLAQIGRRGPTGARRGLPSWGRSCLVYMQRCLSSKSLQTINTQSLPTGAGRVHPSCHSSTLFWSSINAISSIMVVIWHCWTTMIMRLGFCQLNDQTNLNWYHVWGMLQLITTFFQEVIRADSSAGSFSQLGTYNSELRTCVVISVPPRSLRGCHGGSQSKPHHLFAMLLQAVQWPFVDERRITGPNV